MINEITFLWTHTTQYHLYEKIDLYTMFLLYFHTTTTLTMLLNQFDDGRVPTPSNSLLMQPEPPNLTQFWHYLPEITSHRLKFSPWDTPTPTADANCKWEDFRLPTTSVSLAINGCSYDLLPWAQLFARGTSRNSGQQLAMCQFIIW